MMVLSSMVGGGPTISDVPVEDCCKKKCIIRSHALGISFLHFLQLYRGVPALDVSFGDSAGCGDGYALRSVQTRIIRYWILSSNYLEQSPKPMNGELHWLTLSVVQKGNARRVLRGSAPLSPRSRRLGNQLFRVDMRVECADLCDRTPGCSGYLWWQIRQARHQCLLLSRYAHHLYDGVLVDSINEAVSVSDEATFREQLASVLLKIHSRDVPGFSSRRTEQNSLSASEDVFRFAALSAHHCFWKPTPRIRDAEQLGQQEWRAWASGAEAPEACLQCGRGSAEARAERVRLDRVLLADLYVNQTDDSSKLSGPVVDDRELDKIAFATAGFERKWDESESPLPASSSTVVDDAAGEHKKVFTGDIADLVLSAERRARLTSTFHAADLVTGFGSGFATSRRKNFNRSLMDWVQEKQRNERAHYSAVAVLVVGWARHFCDFWTAYAAADSGPRSERILQRTDWIASGSAEDEVRQDSLESRWSTQFAGVRPRVRPEPFFEGREVVGGGRDGASTGPRFAISIDPFSVFPEPPFEGMRSLAQPGALLLDRAAHLEEVNTGTCCYWNHFAPRSLVVRDPYNTAQKMSLYTPVQGALSVALQFRHALELLPASLSVLEVLENHASTATSVPLLSCLQALSTCDKVELFATSRRDWLRMLSVQDLPTKLQKIMKPVKPVDVGEVVLEEWDGPQVDDQADAAERTDIVIDHVDAAGQTDMIVAEHANPLDDLDDRVDAHVGANAETQAESREDTDARAAASAFLWGAPPGERGSVPAPRSGSSQASGSEHSLMGRRAGAESASVSARRPIDDQDQHFGQQQDTWGALRRFLDGSVVQPCIISSRKMSRSKPWRCCD